jgi:hypothetical protein
MRAVAARSHLCAPARGTFLATVAMAAIEGIVMENDNKSSSHVPVSNWTTATGTRPFERYVYSFPGVHGDCAPLPTQTRHP